jgi:hypothetical protein
VRIGLPLARASSAARPAEEPMSMLFPFRYSRARLLPALNTHLIARAVVLEFLFQPAEAAQHQAGRGIIGVVEAQFFQRRGGLGRPRRRMRARQGAGDAGTGTPAASWSKVLRFTLVLSG